LANAFTQSNLHYTKATVYIVLVHEFPGIEPLQAECSRILATGSLCIIMH